MVNKQNPIKPVFPFNGRWVIKDMTFVEWLAYLKDWHHFGHGCFVRRDVETLTGRLVWREQDIPKVKVSYSINPNYSDGHSISKSWFDESRHLTDTLDYLLNSSPVYRKCCTGVSINEPCHNGLNKYGNKCLRCKGTGFINE
jgi:hypothetical protein